ncbi:MAG: hypothetical protein VB039_05275 [Oscillospiraceae bacterium]|nr:hypothetical protein [Oscillospiraceae bacterium]
MLSTKRQMARLADALDAAERAKGVYKAALREMSEERERLMSEAAAAETELLLLRRAVTGLTTQRDRLMRRVSEPGDGARAAGDGGTTQGSFPTGDAGDRTRQGDGGTTRGAFPTGDAGDRTRQGDGGTTQGSFPTGAAGFQAEERYAEND